MDKINRSYNTIDKVITKNNRQSIITIILSITTVIIMAVLMYLNNQKDTYAIDNDGDIVSITKVSKKDVFLIEADNHIRLFYNRFFTYDKSNYETQVELGLHMGGTSVQNLYKTYKVKGWYNTLVNNDLNIHSYVPDKNIKLEYIGKGVAYFIAEGYQEITRAHIKELRKLVIKGTIKTNEQGRIKRVNPHGLKIHNLVILDNEIFSNQ